PPPYTIAPARPPNPEPAPPRRANCSTYPPTVLIRPCPPTTQYKLTSAYPNATIAAAYAAAVPTADQAEVAGADGVGPVPVLPMTARIDRRQAGSAPASGPRPPPPR